MDDIEALFSLDGALARAAALLPEEHGGAVAGELIVIDRDRETGEPMRIDCTRFGSGAYSIPHSVEHLTFETDAKFILAIETGGMFQRLQNHKFWKKANCILVSMAGVPTRATRRFIRRLSDEQKIPVYAFVDCDPYGIANIYRTLKVGSGNAAHINRSSACRRRTYLGVTPQDIIDYKLGRRTRCTDVDIKRAKDALKNDPFFKAPQAVGQGDRAAAEDGRARRAAGARQVGPELRDRRVPAAEAREPRRRSCRESSVRAGSHNTIEMP